MGIFSFIKSAGTKLFGSEVSNEDKAADLMKTVESFGLKVTDLDIEVDGDTAKVWGVAASQEEKEKVLLALGNVDGIANVEDKMTVEVPEPEAQMHTVAKGESLSLIAKKYYGDAMKYKVIFEANKPMLKDPNLIYPGQVLRIPNLNE